MLAQTGRRVILNTKQNIREIFISTDTIGPIIKKINKKDHTNNKN